MSIKNPKGSIWIKTVPPEEATGELKQFYEQWEGRNGSVPSLLPGFSIHLKSMKTALALAMNAQVPTDTLSQLQRQMIITMVSKRLDAPYCTHLHGELLRRQERKADPRAESLADLFKQGRWDEAPLDEKERRMLEFAEILTVSPISIQEQDVQALRDLGFTDRDIFDIANTVAAFNYVNRMAAALGLRREDDWLPKVAESLPMT